MSVLCTMKLCHIKGKTMAKKKKTTNQESVMNLDDTIQKEIIQQYEDIRQSGLTNMFDYTAVKYIAKQLGFDALYNFIKDDMEYYSSVLRNFGKLMKKFDIKQK